MRNSPDDIELARVVDFADDHAAKQGRAHIAGYSCYICGQNGYFPDALGDELMQLQRRHETNIHVICEDCDEQYNVETV